MSRVTLAGFNVDADVLGTVAERAGATLTPETLSAAYARISRDPRPVSELRRLAVSDVDRARASNQRIVFDMGHHSVAEHAVLNFDLADVSRLVVEAIQGHRLASFTEKSQRYVRLDGGFVVPPEVAGTPHENTLRAFVERCFQTYRELCDTLCAAGMDPKAAGEDARYVLPLCVSTQMGLTVNARTLEHMLSRLAAHPLREAREVGAEMLLEGLRVVPSLLRHCDATRHSQTAPAALAACARSLWPGMPHPRPEGMSPEAVRMIHATPQGDTLVIAALVSETLGWPFETVFNEVSRLNPNDALRLLEAALSGLSIHDPLPRAFEHAALTVQMTLSAAAFGQLKRHRMATLQAAPYDPGLGLTIPPSLGGAGLEEVLVRAGQDAAGLWSLLGGPADPVASYALLNAHRREALVTLNLREIYHVSRLREDAHAQWDIRTLAASLSGLARQAFPLTARWLGGKDAVRLPPHPNLDPTTRFD